MPLYHYSARRLSGEKISGQDAASSLAALKSHLSTQGLVLVNAKAASNGWPLPAASAKRLKHAALITFIRELRALISSGMPITAALTQLEKRKGDPLLKATISAVRERLQQGVALDVAFSEHPLIFDRLTQAIVSAGTASGNLSGALDQLLSFMTIRHQLHRKITQAMVYPVFMLALLFVVLAILLLFVLPRFAELYREFDADLPMMTQTLLRIIDAAPIFVPGAIFLVVIAVLTKRLLLHDPSRRLLFDRWRLAIPVLGTVQQQLGLVQISFMMGMLLQAGTTLHKALLFTADSLENSYRAKQLRQIGQAIHDGQSLSSGLAQIELYPELSQALLASGEQTGSLDHMFDEVANLHQDMLNDRLTRLIALVEPTMMLVVGIVLGSVIVAVYLPIFGISTVIQ